MEIVAEILDMCVEYWYVMLVALVVVPLLVSWVFWYTVIKCALCSALETITWEEPYDERQQ